MEPRVNRSGQALVEWAILLPLYVLLLAAILAFAKWFAIDQQLILAVRQGALLYSSGRMAAEQVEAEMKQGLAAGSPSISSDQVTITVGRSHDAQARRFELDAVTIRFHPTPLMQRFKFKERSEICVIKHSPAYGPLGSPVGIPYGRPVDW